MQECPWFTDDNVICRESVKEILEKWRYALEKKRNGSQYKQRNCNESKKLLNINSTLLISFRYHVCFICCEISRKQALPAFQLII